MVRLEHTCTMSCNINYSNTSDAIIVISSGCTCWRRLRLPDCNYTIPSLQVMWKN